MPNTEHALVIAEAQRVIERLTALLVSVGSVENPRGDITLAFSNTRKKLGGQLDDLAFVEQVLDELKREIVRFGRAAFDKASEIGTEQAALELGLYTGRRATGSILQGPTPADQALLALTSRVDSIMQQVLALISTGTVDESEVIGDSGRVGLLGTGTILAFFARWIPSVLSTSHSTILSAAGSVTEKLVKQVIAVIDGKTTQCCLHAHAQVVEFNDPFILTHEPRYSDRQQWPGFHWYCRSGAASVLREQAQDELTDEMTHAAQTQIAKG